MTTPTVPTFTVATVSPRCYGEYSGAINITSTQTYLIFRIYINIPLFL